MPDRPRLITTLLIAVFGAGASAGATDDWPDDEIAENPYQVGAGEHRFLDSEADDGWLHTHNHLFISAQSLQDGWVGLEQCYANLDAVTAVDVVYRYDNMRRLSVTAAEGIGKAQAGETSVALTKVEQGARLCISADVQILRQQPDGHYLLRNGPFHRRFLDGFFPMRVTLDIEFPADLLEVIRVEPRQRSGFELQQSKGGIHIDTRFTGMLNLAFYFQRLPAGSKSQ